MNRFSCFASLAVIFLLASSAMSADWPRFRGPDANGISSESGINKTWTARPPKTLWKLALTDKGYAGPAVADGKLFIIDHNGANDIIRAIDLTGGKELWRFAYVDAAHSNFGFARTTPTFDNGKLYTLSRLGAVHCLDARTGKPLWRKNICQEFKGKKPVWDYSTSPIVDGEKLIVCPGGPGAAVVALDKNTGQTLWNGGGDDAAAYATPVIATINGQKQYVVFAAFHLIGVGVADGRLLWSFPWQTAYSVNAADPIVMDNTVFITSGYRTGCALVEISASGAKALWTNKEMQSHFSTPIYYKGHIYGSTDPGQLICLDPKTGKTLWRKPGFQKGAAVAVDDTLIILDGKTGEAVQVALDPAAYKELGRFTPLGGQSWTMPIVADGKLFIRNTTELVCLDLK